MSSISQPSQRHGRDASPTLVLVIVCAGVVLASLDLFVVNVALPQLGRDLHVGAGRLGELSWVLNAYAIVYAALLVVFGRIAERYRRERGFLLGVAVFVGASAACGAADSLPALIAFRALQAAGAALLTPTSLALILASFPPERRNGAVRAWTAVGGLAAAIGPVVGGVLVAASWRWVFFVNVPIGIAAIALGWRRLPRVAGERVSAPDLLGAALVTAGVGGLAGALVNGDSWGWSSAGTLTTLALATTALLLFVAHSAWHANPLLDRGLLRLRPFTGASAVALLFSAAFGAMLLGRVLWAQEVWHWSALVTGLSIAPGPLMVPLVSFALAGRLTDRLGAGAVIASGSTLFAAGVAWWALAMGLRPDYVGDMLGGMLLTGAGVGLTLPTLMASGAAALPPHAFATGAAVMNMLRQVGLAIGVAMLVALLGAPRSATAVLGAYRQASWATAALALAGGLVAVLLLGTRRRRFLRRVEEATGVVRAGGSQPAINSAAPLTLTQPPAAGQERIV